MAVALTLASCTVIEDRSVCPCWLKVSYQESQGVGNDIRYFIWNEEGPVTDGREDITTGPHMYAVPRGIIGYAGSFGVPEENVRNGMYIIPDGTETAEIYAFKDETIEMSEDFVETSVKPLKQHCNILVRFLEDISTRYQDMSCEITSSSCGMDLRTLQVVDGDFRLLRYPSRDGQFFFRLSRQAGDDLVLTVHENGFRLNVYHLSRIMEINGYDWTDESLRDATITLSLLSQEASVELGDWEDGGISNPEL